MNFTKITLLSGLSFLLTSCGGEQKEEKAEVNEARDLVMASIEAHGGLQKWYDNGQLKFRWTYHMTDRGPQAIVDTVQTVDTKTLNVKHEVVGKDIEFGIHQGEHWISPKDAQFTPPHQFWSLTPYYFIGIPFIFNDAGCNFEKLSEQKEFEGKMYDQVKITYDANSGDSPDDHYVLLIDPETKLTRGTYYTVTNKILGRDKVGPEKFLTLDGLTDVSGVMLASGHKTYTMTDGVIGEQMRFTKVRDVEFHPEGTIDLSAQK